MKYILFLLLLMFPNTSYSQTPITKESANAYFADCVQKQSPDPSFKKESQDMFCACTAARLTTSYTMEDMTATASPDPAIARPAFNKIIYDVYAPCMETPTFDYYYNTCATNPDTSKYGNVKSICQCLGGSMAMHLRNNGQALFKDLLQRNPQMTDPMQALTSDPAFQSFAQRELTACLK